MDYIILFLGVSAVIGGVLTAWSSTRPEKKPDVYIWVGSGPDPFKD